MKVLLLIIALLISYSARAQELYNPVHLEDVQLKKLEIEDFENYEEELGVFKLSANKNIFNRHSTVFNQKALYSAQKTSYLKEIEFNDFIFGLKSDNTFLPNQYNSLKTFFTRYEWDKFSLQTSYINDPFIALQNKGKGTIAITPEYRFNQYIALKTNHTNNFFDKTRKNEIQLSVTPLNDNRLNLNIGAGHIQSDLESKPRSSIRFSTNYKF